MIGLSFIRLSFNFLPILVAVTLICVAGMGCNPEEFEDFSSVDVEYEEEAGSGEPQGPRRISRVFLKDSFEREDLFGEGEINTVFGWRGFIWDWGSPVIGNSGRNVAAVTMGDDVMGEAADGSRALYFYGREGHSVHKIYLLTHAYDLSQFSEVKIRFKYLVFRLNDPQDVVDGVKEFLKFQVCNDLPGKCGVGKNLNVDKINSGPWQTIFSHDTELDFDSFNGKNHVKDDWVEASIDLDLSQYDTSKGMAFRFNAKMRDGFKNNNTANNMQDGAAVDDLVGEAIAIIQPDDPEDPTDDDEDDGGSDDDDDIPVIVPPVGV